MKFAEFEVGARYFLLNMDTTHKMFIEIIAKDEENMKDTVRNRGNGEDIITVYYSMFFLLFWLETRIITTKNYQIKL